MDCTGPSRGPPDVRASRGLQFLALLCWHHFPAADVAAWFLTSAKLVSWDVTNEAAFCAMPDVEVK